MIHRLDDSAQDLLRDLAPKVLGALLRRHRDFGGCEDAVQAAIDARHPARDAAGARYHDVVEFVRERRLHGRGIGWIDAHLLASALVGRLRLWTTEPALALAAKELGIAYE